MFLSRLKERNSALLKTAVAWHQENRIPANCYLFDLDTIRDNARILAEAKREHNLETYIMTKQHGRNPIIGAVALQEGLDSTVCVDIQCVRMMARYNQPVGHVGHLNQIPKGDVEFVAGLRPEVWTVYSFEQAEMISQAASRLGRVQDIMLRVYRPGDVFFVGQEGGFPFQSLLREARRIMQLPNVRIMGVVSFPCFKYNLTATEVAEPTPNMTTIMEAADLLRRELGLEITQINAPGNTSAHAFPILKAHGATHVEPGNGLLGTTTNHKLLDGLAERPAYCYVSEITHIYEAMGYAHGGGLFLDVNDPTFAYKALVGSTPEAALQNEVSRKMIEQIIDYHAPVLEGDRCKVGDTVLMGFRTQAHMTRAWVAVAKGIGSETPDLVGLFDHAGHMVNPGTFEAFSLAEARERVNAVAAAYR